MAAVAAAGAGPLVLKAWRLSAAADAAGAPSTERADVGVPESDALSSTACAQPSGKLGRTFAGLMVAPPTKATCNAVAELAVSVV